VPRFLSAIKSRLVPAGTKPRFVKFGAFKGLKMNLDLQHQTQFVLGLYEREVFRHLGAFLRRAANGIDVGAAEGEYTLLFLAQSNIRRAFAFDPSTRFPAALEANLALNGFGDDGRVSLIKKYVSHRTEPDHCTLDSFDSELQGPCLVKIDVDGGEGSVLQGANKLLDRKDTTWIIETHSAELEIECEQVLRSKGFTTKIVKNAWWRALVPEQRPLAHNRWLVACHGDAEHGL
jgi:Methyltransferase FkbM domain